MGFRLKTSKKTKDLFESLGKSTNLKPFALSKLAISLSLKDTNEIESYESDNNGLELQRSTITGQHDTIYRCLIEQNAKRHLSDDEYFPDYTKKHLDRGAQLLFNKFEYASGNKVEHLVKLLLKEGLNEI